MEIETLAQRAKAIQSNPSLSAFQRRMQIREVMKSAGLKRQELIGELSGLEKYSNFLQEKSIALKSLLDWSGETTAPVLQKNDCSRLHKLQEANWEGRFVLTGEEKGHTAEECAILFDVQQTFVVQHDWAAAFEGAKDFDGDIKLPFDHCCFELRISGRTVLVIAAQSSGEMVASLITECNKFWVLADWREVRESALGEFAWRQVRAISIALDAEVATHSIVRAPADLNRKRVASGRPKLLDYHIVDLSSRHRATIANTGGLGTQRRLHFRRGHWRHYESHKTWIKWMLVGNPELGFVDKHYAI